MGISSIIILPLIVLFIIIYGFIKKVNIYDEFLNGALDGLKTAMIFAINILIKSNIITDSFFFLDNVLKRFSLSSEIIPMCFLRSISGNSTLAIMVDIFKEFGPDSVMGTLASVIQGSSDTTFYVIALYFGSIKIVKNRYALPVGLFADFIGILASFILVYLFY